MDKKAKAIRVIRILRRFRGVESVRHETPFKVLISTILSQRTRDENTIKASKALFNIASTPQKILKLNQKKLEQVIKPSGFYKNKTKTIKRVCTMLVDEYNGCVPNSFEKLIKLPGVGRKTANCVLVYAFRKPAIPVDTHVHRVSNRIGLVKTKTPEQTELALIKIVPKCYWIDLNDSMVKFGQQVCLPRSPRCSICPVKKLCNYYLKNIKD